MNTNNIYEGTRLNYKKLLSFRKIMNLDEVQYEMQKIDLFITENQIERVGPIITTTYLVTEENKFDMEIFVPINVNEINSTHYNFKPELLIENAICGKHKGDPSKLQNIYNDITNHINANKLQQITTGYNVNSSSNINDINEIEIDVYIGVSNNIL